MRSFLKKVWRVLGLAVLLFPVLLFSTIASFQYSASRHRSTERRQELELRGWAPQVVKLSLGKLAEVVETVVEKALDDGTFWERFDTVEERYPDLYSDGSPPPYYNWIAEDFALGKAVGVIPASSELTPYLELSRTERLLLYRAPREGGEGFSLIGNLLSNLWSSRESDYVLLPGQKRSWYLRKYVSALPPRVINKPKSLSPDVARDWLSDKADELVLSPIAGGLLRADYGEFTPGQAWARVIWRGDEFERHKNGYLLACHEYSPQQIQNWGFLHYRIYGERTAIAEGIRLVRVNQRDWDSFDYHYWDSSLRAQKQTVDRLIATDFGDDLWESVDSIEEAWPDVCEARLSPSYYAQLEMWRNLHDEVGYSQRSARLVPYNRLSESERLMLAHRSPGFVCLGDDEWASCDSFG